MEKPIHLSTVLYELLVSKLGDNPKAREILENPSQYLLHECEIFSTPELLLIDINIIKDSFDKGCVIDYI